MLSVIGHGLRDRWITFLGTFVALCLGVSVLTVMGLALASAAGAPDRAPERFAAARVVVAGADTVRMPVPGPARETRLSGSKAVPPSVARDLAELGRTVEDRSLPVRVTGSEEPAGEPGEPVELVELVGRPWSVAEFAPYRIVAGRAPARDGEAVVHADRARVGERLRTDRGELLVVGHAAAPTVFEDAVFLTDAHTRRLAPRLDHLLVDAAPAAVRAALAGTDLRVLTGSDRRLTDPGTARERDTVTALVSLFGTAGGVSGFVAVFVVASTSAYSVTRRRREFGLLRTTGATPGQVRRAVYGEGAVVGAVSSLAGCALGGWAAPVLARRLVAAGAAPDWFRIGADRWPYHLAFWTGLTVALAGVAAASWRAGRTAPTEALRQAAVDRPGLPWGRWALGGGALLTAVALAAYSLVTEPGELLHRKTYTSRPILLVVAVALLSPALVAPAVRLLTWLPARLPGATGELVRAGTVTGARRAAAVAAPVLVAVALTGSLLGTTATLDAAKTRELRARTVADLVVTDPGRAAVAALRKVPGAVVSPSSATEVLVREESVAVIRSAARAADPAALAATTRLPVVAGDLRDLDDRSIVVNEEWERHRVGQRVTVWRADGRRVTLRIAAVLRVGTGSQGAYVTPAHAAGAPVDRVDVRVAPGADPRAVAVAVRAAAGGARVLDGGEFVRVSAPRPNAVTRTGFLLLLGIVVLYTALSLANTTLMAAADRSAELRALRLAGATRGQTRRLVAGEACALVTTGAVLGALVAAVQLGSLAAALALLGSGGPVAVPWGQVAGVTAGFLAVAVATALLAVRDPLRT
ncbi:FtsX-like permease family protein [Streptomyces uncialis]|uniref:ABC transporter permease n=1 Tax=Streptomyces uncialis TaxID=1048205 RepID=UPI0037F3B3B3